MNLLDFVMKSFHYVLRHLILILRLILILCGNIRIGLQALM